MVQIKVQREKSLFRPVVTKQLFLDPTEPDLGPKQCTGLYSEMTFWLHLCMTETGKLLFQLDFSFFWKHGHSYTSHF